MRASKPRDGWLCGEGHRKHFCIGKREPKPQVGLGNPPHESPAGWRDQVLAVHGLGKLDPTESRKRRAYLLRKRSPRLDATGLRSCKEAWGQSDDAGHSPVSAQRSSSSPVTVTPWPDAASFIAARASTTTSAGAPGACSTGSFAAVGGGIGNNVAHAWLSARRVRIQAMAAKKNGRQMTLKESVAAARRLAETRASSISAKAEGAIARAERLIEELQSMASAIARGSRRSERISADIDHLWAAFAKRRRAHVDLAMLFVAAVHDAKDSDAKAVQAVRVWLKPRMPEVGLLSDDAIAEAIRVCKRRGRGTKIEGERGELKWPTLAANVYELTGEKFESEDLAKEFRRWKQGRE